VNNEQIDNTSYYELPSGRQLEAFIAEQHLSFAEGSALKYLWRAGKKDGESAEKDRAKAKHFIEFESRAFGVPTCLVENHVNNLLQLAKNDYQHMNVGILHSRTLQDIGAHYRHAKEKHPYFADRLFIDDMVKPSEALAVCRAELNKNIEEHNVDTLDVLKCEILEMYDAALSGNIKNAVDECYDAIAVMLRIIDVIEGRQPLGNPKEGAK